MTGRRWEGRLAAPIAALICLAGAAGPAAAQLEAKPHLARENPSLDELLTPAEIEAEFLVEPRDFGVLPEEPEEPSFVLSVDAAELAFDPLPRMAELVPDDLWAHFDLYLYINKAADGPLAQQMLVFERAGERDLELRHRWLASTGRERQEQYFTTTPTGLFKLDRDRFFVERRSYTWNGARMPYAMFFDYEYATRKSGLAIHAATGSGIGYLGQRASGGCIRLPLAQAKWLFETIQRDYAGDVPEFLFVAGRGTVRDGRLERLADGTPLMDAGYRVLLVVDQLTGPISQK